MAVIGSDTALSSDDAQVEEHFLEDPTSSNPNHHKAFMQCRACCNCDGGCNYYGKGKFDSNGNYLGK